MSAVQQTPAPTAGVPWWRVRMMWLVLGGPLAVVVAATVTAVIAVRGADPPIERTPSAGARPGSLGGDPQAPAVQGRNHAATARP